MFISYRGPNGEMFIISNIKIVETENAGLLAKANYLIDSIQKVLVQHYGEYMGRHQTYVYPKQWRYVHGEDQRSQCHPVARELGSQHLAV